MSSFLVRFQFVLGLCLGVNAAAWAVSPYSLSYGGRLADTSEAPVPGPVDLKIKFFDAATGGNQLGGDVDDQAVVLSNGTFQAPIVLGGAAFQAIFGGGEQVFIEVTDVTHGQTYPRQSFSAVPYALRVPVDQATITYDSNGNLTLANPSSLPVSNGAFTAPIGLEVLASDPASLTAADAGKLWYNGGIKYWNGSSAQLLGVAGGGLQSLNGITDNTQTLAVAIGGTSPTWVDAGSSHTLDLPMASTAGVAGGLVANGDWTVFNSKVSSQWAGDGTAIHYNGGNVGIGTTSPGAALDVNGTVIASTLSSRAFNGLTIQSGPTYASTRALTINGGTPLVGFNTDYDSIYVEGTYSSANTNINYTTFHINDAIGQFASATGITRSIFIDPILNTTTDYRALEISSNAGVAIYQTGSSAKNYFAGNVGIGTSSPAAPLAVGGVSQFQVDANGNLTSINGATYSWPASHAAGALTSDASGNLSWGSASSIDTNNNGQSLVNVATLSIGTTAAGADLLFGSGTTRTESIQSVASGAGTNLTIQAGGTSGANQGGGSLLLSSGAANGLGASQLQFQTYYGATPTTAMTIVGSGDVGIGTTGPAWPLDVQTTWTTTGSANVIGGFSSFGDVARLTLLTAAGTQASPVGVPSASNLGVLGFRGYTSSGAFTTANTAYIKALTTEDFTNTANGTALLFATTPNGSTTAATRLWIDQSGNVGIGMSSPTSALTVSGAARNAGAVLNTTGTIDFSTGNLQYTAGSCGAFVLYNLKDGGSYSFAVQGTSVATCSFTGYSDSGVTPVTVHMPPDHAATTPGKQTLYTFLVMGAHAYASWIPGY